MTSLFFLCVWLGWAFLALARLGLARARFFFALCLAWLGFFLRLAWLGVAWPFSFLCVCLAKSQARHRENKQLGPRAKPSRAQAKKAEPSQTKKKNRAKPDTEKKKPGPHYTLGRAKNLLIAVRIQVPPHHKFFHRFTCTTTIPDPSGSFLGLLDPYIGCLWKML